VQGIGNRVKGRGWGVFIGLESHKIGLGCYFSYYQSSNI